MIHREGERWTSYDESLGMKFGNGAFLLFGTWDFGVLCQLYPSEHDRMRERKGCMSVLTALASLVPRSQFLIDNTIRYLGNDIGPSENGT
jgi:hypothetical protein